MLGQPLFLHTVARVAQATRVGPLVVATSIEPDDATVAHACWDAKVPYFRGHPTDLVDRVYRTGVAYDATALLLIPAADALVDATMIDAVAGVYELRRGQVDYVSNHHLYPRDPHFDRHAVSAFLHARPDVAAYRTSGRQDRTRSGCCHTIRATLLCQDV